MNAYDLGMLLAFRQAGFEKEAGLTEMMGKAKGWLGKNKGNIALGVGLPVAAGVGLAGYVHGKSKRKPHRLDPYGMSNPIGHTFL